MDILLRSLLTMRPSAPSDRINMSYHHTYSKRSRTICRAYRDIHESHCCADSMRAVADQFWPNSAKLGSAAPCTRYVKTRFGEELGTASQRCSALEDVVCTIQYKAFDELRKAGVTQIACAGYACSTHAPTRRLR
jgi:hypothetical protein